MTFEVVFTLQARAGALDGFRWLSKQSPEAASKWYRGLEKAIESLKKQPRRNPIAGDESDYFGIEIREKLYGRRRGIYRILYSIIDNKVFILHIRHSARDSIEFTSDENEAN
jgi:plasmid stabilization system protein ParE